jgi:hypothetical protein
MEETPDEETARLLAPYIAERDAAAHRCLRALLDGQHAESQALLTDYQILCLAAESAMAICGWFDAGTAAQHIDVQYVDGPPAPADQMGSDE